MSPRRFCCCRPAGPPWPTRPDDRFCGQCGRELLAVLPFAPVLTAGPSPVLAAYLQPAARSPLAGQRFLTGRLMLHLVGIGDALPRVRVRPVVEPAPRLRSARLSGHATLQLLLETSVATPVAATALGRAAVTVELHGHAFCLEVQAFCPPLAAGELHLEVERGGAFADGVLWLERGGSLVRTRLLYTPAGQVPVQWQSLECRHPAVRMELVGEVAATPRAEALVTWDPTLLRLDESGEEVLFHLRLRGLPRLAYPLTVRRRQPDALRFRPGVLHVPHQPAERLQTHLVQLTNTDASPVIVERVEALAPWIAAAPAVPLPFALHTGDEAILTLDLRPDRLPAVLPADGAVAVDVRDRGRQRLAVRVEALEPLRRLPGPLLVDPGPPRVVLAYWDRSRRALVYPDRHGDAGLEPEELGLTTDEYAAAVYGRLPAHSLVRFLVAAVLAYCRRRLHLDAAAVCLCGHPWVPADLALPGVEVHDWWRAAAGVGGALSPGTPVVRLDTWDCRAVSGADLPSLRAAVVRWLSVTGAAAGSEHDAPGWLELACESLFVDYRWGADYAWRRLQRACWRHQPASRPALPVPAQADRMLAHATAEVFSRLAQLLDPLPRPDGAATVVLAPLFANCRLARLGEAAATAAGQKWVCTAPAWLEGLARLREGDGDR